MNSKTRFATLALTFAPLFATPVVVRAANCRIDKLVKNEWQSVQEFDLKTSGIYIEKKVIVPPEQDASVWTNDDVAVSCQSIKTATIGATLLNTGNSYPVYADLMGCVIKSRSTPESANFSGMNLLTGEAHFAKSVYGVTCVGHGFTVATAILSNKNNDRATIEATAKTK